MNGLPKSCAQVLDFVSKDKTALLPLRAKKYMDVVF